MQTSAHELLALGINHIKCYTQYVSKWVYFLMVIFVCSLFRVCFSFVQFQNHGHRPRKPNARLALLNSCTVSNISTVLLSTTRGGLLGIQPPVHYHIILLFNLWTLHVATCWHALPQSYCAVPSAFQPGLLQLHQYRRYPRGFTRWLALVHLSTREMPSYRRCCGC